MTFLILKVNYSPPHNIVDTSGRKYGKVGKLYETIKAQPNVHFIDKTL